MASVIRAFSAFHVCRLTGLSLRQLSYWDDTEFFSPYYASENRRSPFSRVYSFEDVVGLRVIAILRNDHKIPLQKLRKIAEQLSQYHPRPWSGLVLYVCGKKVFLKSLTLSKSERLVILNSFFQLHWIMSLLICNPRPMHCGIAEMTKSATWSGIEMSFITLG
jgi:DNA-binding transcriptional MerR regulator